MSSTPTAHVTKTPGYIATDLSSSPNEAITVFPIGAVPVLQSAMNAIHQDYLRIIDILCTTPAHNETGKRRIRRALSAAVKGWSPAQYAARSDADKDEVVEEILGRRRANDGRWPKLLFYLGGGMAGTLGMSPSVYGEMKLCELVPENLTTTEWWDESWNNDSCQWPTAYGWTARCPSVHNDFLYLAGGYAVHLAKQQVDQQDPIRIHAKVTILHELTHYIRSFVRFSFSHYNNELSCLFSASE